MTSLDTDATTDKTERKSRLRGMVDAAGNPPRAPRRTSFITRVVTVSSTLSPPAVRMLYIEVACLSDKGKGDFEVSLIPVVSLESRLVEVYVRRADEDDEDRFSPSMTAEDLIEAGFTLSHRDLEHGALIVLPGDSDFHSTIDYREFRSVNAAYSLVTCPWDSRHDEKQLAKIIAELKGDAINWNTEVPF